MIWRIKTFLSRSLRNKLLVTLPLTLTFVLVISSTLSILSLKEKAYDHFAQEQGEHLPHLTYLYRSLPRKEWEKILPDHLLYFQITDRQGFPRFQYSLVGSMSPSEKSEWKKRKNYFVRKVPGEKGDVLEIYHQIGEDQILGGFSTKHLTSLLFSEKVTLIGILLVAVVAVILALITLTHLITDPLIKLAREVDQMTESKSYRTHPSLAERKDEVGLLAKKMNELSEHVKTQEEKLAEQKQAETLGKIATQVAHDIRSPLSALQTAAQYLGQMKIEDPKSADVLNLLELSAKRLTGIADDLLKKHKGGVEEKSDFSIHQVLDELVGEFQGQDQYQKVRFSKQYSSKAIQIHGDITKIQRTFGNIIKNAAEAMQFEGSITLSTQENEEKVVVCFADSGSGMSSDKLERVLQGGFTEGKTGGHGIGTKVVKETVEDHGGKFWGKSILGKGTSFFIELPRVTQEAGLNTFSLALNPKEPVLIVDDDPSLREQWRLILQDQGIKTLLCNSMEDLLRQGIRKLLTKTAVVDYHYDNSEKTGEDIIRYLQEEGFTNISLCTAEYWKPSVQKLAKDLGVAICPKPLPKIVIVNNQQERSPEGAPLGQTNGTNGIASVTTPSSNGNKGYTVLVIDDDRGIRMSWEMMKEKLGIAKLHTYANLETLQKEPFPFRDIDIAFVDKNIEGSDYAGAQVINYLRSQGVSTIVLASGEREEELRKDPQFSEINFIIDKKIPTDFKAFFS